jgi:hypothetical protein
MFAAASAGQTALPRLLTAAASCPAIGKVIFATSGPVEEADNVLSVWSIVDAAAMAGFTALVKAVTACAGTIVGNAVTVGDAVELGGVVAAAEDAGADDAGPGEEAAGELAAAELAGALEAAEPDGGAVSSAACFLLDVQPAACTTTRIGAA